MHCISATALFDGSACITMHNIMYNRTTERYKLAITEREGIPVDEQRVIYAGSQFEHGRTLASYKVKDNSTLHLVLRLRGC
jgi:Ubiquitin family